MNHEQEQLLGAYALGTLDPEEQAELELHLDGCQSCRALLADYQQVADGLLHLAPAAAPAPELRDRLSEMADARPRRPNRDRRRIRLHWPQAALAGVGLALVAANLFLVSELMKLSARSESLLADQRANQTALALLSYPNSQRADLEQGQLRGSFLYEDGLGIAVLNVWGMPPLGADQAYQLWLIGIDGSRASGGLIAPTDDQQFVSLVVWAPETFETIQSIGITIEPASGSQSPSGPRVLGTDLTHSP